MTCGAHINNVGTDIQVTIQDCNGVALDISDSTALAIVLKAPSGTSTSHTATFVNSGTDGLIRYVTTSGDLDEVGTWKIQGVVTVSTSVWYSSVESFTVYRNL